MGYVEYTVDEIGLLFHDQFNQLYYKVVGASFFQPVNQHLRLEKDKSGEDKLLLKNVHSDGSQCSDDEEIMYIAKPTVIEIVKPKTLASRISDAMDLKLLKDLTFINICVGISLTYTATVNFSMIFPYFLQVKIDVNSACH